MTPEECLAQLTRREKQVLSHILEGKASKEVASLLHLSKRTVDFHLVRVYDKLNVGNRIQAYRKLEPVIDQLGF